MNPKSNWHKRSDHAKQRKRDLLSTSRSIRQSLSGSTHSMSNVRHPSTNVMTIQGTTCGSSAEKIFVGSTWYLGGHVIIGMRLLPRVQVLIVAHLPFFRPVGFVTPLATCFPDIIRNCSLLADWALSLHLLRSSASTSVWRQLQAL